MPQLLWVAKILPVKTAATTARHDIHSQRTWASAPSPAMLAVRPGVSLRGRNSASQHCRGAANAFVRRLDDSREFSGVCRTMSSNWQNCVHQPSLGFSSWLLLASRSPPCLRRMDTSLQSSAQFEPPPHDTLPRPRPPARDAASGVLPLLERGAPPACRLGGRGTHTHGDCRPPQS